MEHEDLLAKIEEQGHEPMGASHLAEREINPADAPSPLTNELKEHIPETELNVAAPELDIAAPEFEGPKP